VCKTTLHSWVSYQQGGEVQGGDWFGGSLGLKFSPRLVGGRQDFNLTWPPEESELPKWHPLRDPLDLACPKSNISAGEARAKREMRLTRRYLISASHFFLFRKVLDGFWSSGWGWELRKQRVSGSNDFICIRGVHIRVFFLLMLIPELAYWQFNLVWFGWEKFKIFCWRVLNFTWILLTKAFCEPPYWWNRQSTDHQLGWFYSVFNAGWRVTPGKVMTSAIMYKIDLYWSVLVIRFLAGSCQISTGDEIVGLILRETRANYI
jgi:hypothetical protein